MAASEFLQKDIDKFIECQTNENTKTIHIRRKIAKHGTEGNELKCQLLRPSSDLQGLRPLAVFAGVFRHCLRGF